MNSADTIDQRMHTAGLPYNVTGSETPLFVMTGSQDGMVAVVGLWRDSVNDNEEAFVGFYYDDEDLLAEVQRKVAKLKGCYAVTVVRTQWFGR